MSTEKEISFVDVVRFVWGYWRKYPGFLIVFFALLTISLTAEVVRPLVQGRLIDAFTTGDATALTTVFGLIALLVVLGLVNHWFRAVPTMWWSTKEAEIMKQAHIDGFARVTHYATDWHINTFAGSTVRKIGRGARALETFSDKMGFEFFSTCFVGIGMIVTISLHSLLLGGVVAIGMCTYATFSIILVQRFLAPRRRAANEQDTVLGGALADAVTCNPTTKAFGAEKREITRFSAVVEQWRHYAVRNWHASNILEIAQNTALILFQAVMFAIAAWLWSRHVFTTGDVVFVMFNFQMIWRHLSEIGRQVRDLQQSVSDLEDLVGFSLTPPDIVNTPHASVLTVPRGEIRFDRVGFCYPSQTVAAYQDFSLTIRPGEKVALVGHSGSGKSTFVKLLMRLYDVQSGAITIDKQNISAVTQESLHRAIALVPQEPLLFHRSLAENIAYGRPEAQQKEIETAAKKAHAHEFIRQLPETYATYVGERGVKLSGGERQRVAIARAILSDAPILILDEATSSLDSISESYIQDALDKLMKGRTTIIVAHRLSTIKKVDRILVFDNGRIVEEGTHTALLKKRGGVYRQFYEMQAGGFLADVDETAAQAVPTTDAFTEDALR